MSVVGWALVVVAAGIIVTSIMVGIQYNMITTILNRINKINTKKIVNSVTVD